MCLEWIEPERALNRGWQTYAKVKVSISKCRIWTLYSESLDELQSVALNFFILIVHKMHHGSRAS